jgi:prolyl-tRNA editing enzyme YbaK/EbsC (Cys-tRNA(Pro) deacylase)
MRTSKDLIDYMERNAIHGKVISLPVHTPTVESAAQAVGTSPDRIVKSLLFLVEGEAVMAIASGKERVDRQAIAAYFGVSPAQVKLADAATVQGITGYPIGAVPPFGHIQHIPTLIDPQVAAQDVVYAGGGDVDALLRTSPGEIARATQAQELDLRRQGGADEA